MNRSGFNIQHLLLVLTPALLIFTLATCAPKDDGRVHIEFWALGREGEMVAQLVRDFEKLNPGIAVDVQQMPWTAAHEKLLTAIVGDSTPDVAQIGNSWIPEFHAINAIAELRPFVTSLDQGDYFSGIWKTNEVDGVLYGIPWYVDTRVLFFRRDLLTAAGYPDGPKTWSEWLDACAKLKARGTPWPILLPTNEWAQPITFGLQRDAQFLREDGRFGDFSNPAFVGALDFYFEFFRREYAPVMTAGQVANQYQQFAEGDIAMFVGGPWQIGEVKRRLSDEFQARWGTAPLPAPDGKPFPGASLAGGGSLVIFNRSEKKEAAWKLIEYLSQPAQQVRFYDLTGDLPARRSAWNAPSVAKDPYLAAYRVQLENVVPTPDVPQWEQIVTAVFDVSDVAIRRRQTPQDAARRLDARTDAILEKRRWMMARAENEP